MKIKPDKITEVQKQVLLSLAQEKQIPAHKLRGKLYQITRRAITSVGELTFSEARKVIFELEQ